MTPAAIAVHAHVGAPPSSPAWDEMARASANLVQSTHFDAAQAFFAMQPVYFVADDGGRLLGGVKLYRGSSRTLPRLSRRLTLSYLQFGEIVGGTAAGGDDTLADALRAAVIRHLQAEGAVSYRASGFYGGEAGLVRPSKPPSALFEFNVAAVDLARPSSEIWSSLHKSHRAEIRKAERHGLAFVPGGAVEDLVALMDETYKGQTAAGPQRGYVAHLQRTLPGHAELFFVTGGGELLAGALCLTFGDVAYWEYGGTRRGSAGAGTLLHWRLIEHLRARGFSRYLLGQVAARDDPRNPKFAVGITRFKRHFGVVETASSSATWVLRPLPHAAWRALASAAVPFRRLKWTTRA